MGRGAWWRRWGCWGCGSTAATKRRGKFRDPATKDSLCVAVGRWQRGRARAAATTARHCTARHDAALHGTAQPGLAPPPPWVGWCIVGWRAAIERTIGRARQVGSAARWQQCAHTGALGAARSVRRRRWCRRAATVSNRQPMPRPTQPGPAAPFSVSVGGQLATSGGTGSRSITLLSPAVTHQHRCQAQGGRNRGRHVARRF